MKERISELIFLYRAFLLEKDNDFKKTEEIGLSTHGT